VINTKFLLQHIDLARLVESCLREPGKQSGRWTFWHCPFHPGDQTPSLGVNREECRWFCFGCRKGGDAITWLMDFQRLSFKAACEYLGEGKSNNESQPDFPVIKPSDQPKRHPDNLQDFWKVIIETCQEMLWQPEGAKALEYLHQRGLRDTTLQSPFFRIGYSPGTKISGVWVDRGIVIPCFTTCNNMEIEYVSYIKVRRPDCEPKYKKLAGQGAKLSGMFGAEWALGADVVFITEGEFDALLLWQEARDFVGVCTLGGASDQLDFARFGLYLLAAKHIFIAYDNDPAGQKAVETWKEMSARVLPAQVPAGKDITEYWQAGGDLSFWVMEILKTHEIV
jgi:DNA primase